MAGYLCAKGWEALVEAAVDQPNIMKLLLTEALTNEKREPAVIWAARHGHAECLRVLLEAGVSPIHSVNPPLTVAAMLGRTDCVRMLLEAGDQLSNVHCSCRTAVACAANNRHLDCVRLLLEAGANPAIGSFNAPELVGAAE